MKLSEKSYVLIISNLYFTTLIFANNYICNLFKIGNFYKYLIILMPLLLIISLLYDLYKAKKLINIYKNKTFCISLIFIFFCTLSIFLGINISLFNIKAIIHILIIVTIPFLLYNFEISEHQFANIKKHIFIVFSIVCILGILQYIFDFGLTNKIDKAKYIGIKGRVISTYHIATVLDKYIIMILAILSYDLICKKNIYKTLLYIIASIVLALTFTRAGVIAFVMLSITFFGFSIYKKKYKNIIIIFISFLTIFLIPGYKYTFQSATDFVYKAINLPKELRISIISKNDKNKNNIPDISDDSSIVYRNYYEKVGESIIKEYYILGIGLGNYTYIYDKQNVNNYLKNNIKLPEKYMYPHNGYIQTAAEIGIIGLIIYILFFSSFLISSLKNKNIKDLYPCFLLLFFFFLGTLTEGLFTTKQYMYIFIIIYSIYCNRMIKNKEKN